MTSNEYPLEGSVFISYRRTDVGDAARLLHARLSAVPGLDVFLDEAELHPGAKLDQSLQARLGGCSWVVAMVGPRWLSPKLQDPNDYVRRELAYALRQGTTVIAVLVDGAQLPAARQLPPDLIGLRDRLAPAWRTDQAPDALMVALERTGPPSLDELLDWSEANPDSKLEVRESTLAFRSGGPSLGLPMSEVVVPGRWQIRFQSTNGASVSLTVDIESGREQHFRGVMRGPPKGLLRRRKTEPVEGRWSILYDSEHQRFLGLHLHGVRGTREFLAEVPMLQQLGAVLHGRDGDGTEWVSQNVQPQVL
jgi:hypothetical protein